MKTAILLILTAVSGVCSPFVRAETSSDGIWADVPEAESTLLAEPYAGTLLHQRRLSMNRDLLSALLDDMRAEAQIAAGRRLDVVFSLPLPDGGFEEFAIQEAPVMPPALATKFPEIVTFEGRGLDTPGAWGRFDWSPRGFHGYVQIDGRTFYVNPEDHTGDLYTAFFRQDLRRPPPSFVQERDSDVAPLPEPDRQRPLPRAPLERSSGSVLRTYRSAIAATGEYTQFHGGTVADGMAAVVTAINRVTGIYERELAVRLELVADNDRLIYTNPASDPYTNGDAFALLAENQANLDSEIGSTGYDVGHVFSTGGGGLASLGVICHPNAKARGETGSGYPVGDPFWVDYVAHELGHQFGANHTFNGVLSSCSGNRNEATAYEPGSGTTIMAYAGICGADNIQPNSDDYMHAASFDEITAYLTLDPTGSSCGSITPTANSAPSVDAGIGGFTIPRDTPFSLVGWAMDAEGEPLLYTWEQWDLGPAGSPYTPSGDAPLFRSFSPVDSPSRTFPQWPDILGNSPTLGELLPGYSRGMNFRLTVRDGGGGVNSSDIGFAVDELAGPFVVTAPNTAGAVLESGSPYPVTWNVAATDTAPIDCGTVDILLSTDGGLSFDTTLAAGTANDGSESVLFPSLPTSAGRLLIQCSDNIFFDVSDHAFTISAGSGNLLQVLKTGTGLGRVSSTPPGIDCGTDCEETYSAGTMVDLAATPEDGSLFAGWMGGGCSGTGICNVLMNTAQTVTASFSPSGDTLCETGTLTLVPPGYSSGFYDFASETEIITSGEVTVSAGATVQLQAPRVELRAGFSVAAGGILQVATEPVSCGAR